MADQQFVMTKAGYEETKEKLRYLQITKRQEIVERIQEARSHGDLSENAEYEAARNEQAANEGEIERLTYVVKNAVILEDNRFRMKLQYIFCIRSVHQRKFLKSQFSYRL